MKYEKPQLVHLGPASGVVRGQNKKSASTSDGTTNYIFTVNAYEADE